MVCATCGVDLAYSLLYCNRSKQVELGRYVSAELSGRRVASAPWWPGRCPGSVDHRPGRGVMVIMKTSCHSTGNEHRMNCILRRGLNIVLSARYYTAGHKRCQLTFVHIFAKYWPILKNNFTSEICRKFAIKTMINISLHLHWIATLPCKI